MSQVLQALLEEETKNNYLLIPNIFQHSQKESKFSWFNKFCLT